MNLVDGPPITIETVQFPEERAVVAAVQQKHDFHELGALHWGMERGLVQVGSVTIAEISPTLRCPEACPLCPDSSLILRDKISKGEVEKDEARVGPEVMKNRIQLLHDLGVTHFMFIGGTIDHLPELPDLIETTLTLDDRVHVSWFTDMITQIDQQTGAASVVLKQNLDDGWIRKVATHVSMDYPFRGDLFAGQLELPTKRGRSLKFAQDGQYSRRFKSEYGAVGARRLVEEGVRRVIVNITVGHANFAEVPAIYDQVAQLQAYGKSIGSPTEVMLTFSEMIWRPHQARGDSPIDSPASAGLQMVDMPQVNQIFNDILDDTYYRLATDQPRLLANSSGYTSFIALPEFRQIVVEQAVPYADGRPEIFDVTPTGDIRLDPMFFGPELPFINSIFGYRDRVFPRSQNPFTRFQQDSRKWFPNLIST